MITLRASADRGHFDHGWLDARHSFSFGEYSDPRHDGFRSLRVLNEDRVQPGRGFPTHGHADMEILSFVIAGALSHQDSMGNGSVIRPGDVQRMSAGTGVTHSERNDSASEITHLLQVWIRPERRGLRPSYEQRTFPEAERRNALRLVASPDGRDSSVTVAQDVFVLASTLERGVAVEHALRPGRAAWLQVIRGRVDANGCAATAGDGVAFTDEASVRVTASEPSEILLFDLA